MLTFTFEDVPMASFLTCVAIRGLGVDGADPQEQILFDDVPFWEVSQWHASADDADPFEAEERPEEQPAQEQPK